MLIFWRDSFIGVLAWYCADNAVHFFPRATVLHVDKVSHFFTLLMFEPWKLFLPTVFFLFATYFLYFLLKFHGKHVFRRRGLPAVNRLLHLMVFGFSLYLITIQTIQMPLATAAAVVTIVLINLVHFLRNRALEAEINKLLEKK